MGGTIQVVPHVTDAIKQHIYRLASESEAEVVVAEVGGTVGDIEGLPFLEAIRQMRNEVGRDEVFYIHVTFLPYISATGELKTKPTQHSVRELRGIGILPDAIVCRSDHPVEEDLREKIAVHCDVPRRGVIGMPTVDTVYQAPLLLEEEGLGDLMIERLSLPTAERDMAEWGQMVDLILKPKESMPIAVVGKYVELQDSYISVKEALHHAGIAHERTVELLWIGAEEIEEHGPDELLASVSGIVVPGGFGPRGVEGMIETVRYAREHEVPYLGLCLGMQVMAVEAARNLLGKSLANSTEFDPDTPDPVIDLMPDQRTVTEMGGTMRLGLYPCKVVEDTWAAKAYSEPVVNERHRHRFEMNNAYREELESVNFWPTGLSPDDRLVEIMEMDAEKHPFMVGVQFHPEFLSRPNRPHPLFDVFVGVAKKTLREGGQHILPFAAQNSS